MELSEKEIPMNINWTGKELDAVIKMLQIFPLALNEQNVEMRSKGTIEKHRGWTSEGILKKLWSDYNFPFSDINRARTALGRFALIRTRQVGKHKKDSFGCTYVFVDVNVIYELLSGYGIEVPSLEKPDWGLDDLEQDIIGEESSSLKVDISAFYENGLEKLDQLIPDNKGVRLTPLSDTAEPEPEEEKTPQSMSGKVHKLLQYNLLSEHKVLIVLWKLGNGNTVSRKRLRDSMGLQLAELALRGSSFTKAVHRAANEGLVMLDGESIERNSQLITPLHDLDYLTNLYEEGRKKEKTDKEPHHKLPVPPDKDNPQVLELLQGNLTGARKVLLTAWMFGGEGVEMWVLRDIALSKGLFSCRRGFARSFCAAKGKGLIFVEGDGETAVITPVIDLDTLVHQIKKPRKETKTPVRPESVDPRIQAFLKDKSLTEVEKLLVFLWQFGPKGTERWNLRAILKDDGADVGIEFIRFSKLVNDAARNGKRRLALLKVISGDNPDNDIICPLLSLEDMTTGKHIIRKPKAEVTGKKGKERGLTQKEQLLIMLLRFGKRGAKRKKLCERVERVSGKLGLRFYFPLILRQAHISHLLKMTRGMNRDNDFVVPLVTLAELKRKYRGNQTALGQISQITAIK